LKIVSDIQLIKIFQGRMQSNPCTFVTESAVPQNAVHQSLSTTIVPAGSPFVSYWQVSTDCRCHRCPEHSGCPGGRRRSLR